MNIKVQINKLACTLFAISLAWEVFWFGGVHPSESWVGFMCLLICGLYLSYELYFKNIRLNFDYIDIIILTILSLWSLLTVHSSTVGYYSIKTGVGYLIFILALLLVKKSHGVRNNSKYLILFALLCGVTLSLYAIHQRLTTSNSVLGVIKPDVYSGRYGGVFINPNHLASFLICLHPIILVQVLKRNIKIHLRLLMCFMYILMGVAIILTMSRGGWIGLLLGSLMVLSVRFVRNYRSGIIGAVLIIFFICSGVFSYSDKFRSRINSLMVADSSDSGMFRIWLWKSAFQMWADNKLIGVGPGQFQVRFPQYRPPTIPVNPEYVHNEYLEILVEYGVLGFAAFNLILYKIIFIPLWFNSKFLIDNIIALESNAACLVLGCIGGVCSLMVHAMFEFCFHIPAIAILGALIIGINWNASEVGLKSQLAPVRVFNNYFSSIAMLLTTIFIFIINLQAAREDMFLRKASIGGIAATDRIEYLTRAMKVQPSNPKTFYWIGEELRILAINSPGNRNQGLNDAMNYFKKSALIDPYFPGSFMSMGLCFKEIGDNKAALDNLKKANLLGINDIKNLNCLSRLLIDNGDLISAKRLNHQSLSINWWNNSEAIYFKNLMDQNY